MATNNVKFEEDTTRLRPVAQKESGLVSFVIQHTPVTNAQQANVLLICFACIALGITGILLYSHNQEQPLQEQPDPDALLQR